MQFICISHFLVKNGLSISFYKERGAHPSCRLPSDGDRVGVSSEDPNVLLHPLESSDLVQEAPVPLGMFVSSALNDTHVNQNIVSN